MKSKKKTKIKCKTPIKRKTKNKTIIKIKTKSGTHIIKDTKAFEKAYKKYKVAPLMLDRKFRETLKYDPKNVAREILQVVLGDKKLVVLKCISQRDYSEAIFHGVILDCECILASGEIVNIEIQNLFYDDPFWRMSYNQSIMRVENAPKKSVFRSKDQRRIISIMFCSQDVIGSGEAISELVLIDKKTKKVIDNGINQFYIYINGKTNNKKLKELLKIFRESDYFNEDLFPSLSIAKHNANNLEKGDYMLLYGSDLEMYVKGERSGIKVGEARGEEKGRNALIKELIKNGTITLKEAETKYGYKKKKSREPLKI